MGNTRQLVNWYWWKNYFPIIVMVVFVILAQMIYWIASDAVSASTQKLISMILAMSMASGVFSAVIVFTGGHNLDLTSGNSAFPAWLYTLPISSVQLAMVPVIGMIIGLAWSWIPFALAIRAVQPSLSIVQLVFLPWLGLCGGAFWLQALAWRPFPTGWHRLSVVLIISLIVAFSVPLAGLMPIWFPAFAVVTFAMTGFMAAFYSVEKARHHGQRLKNVSSSISAPTLSTESNPTFASFTKLQLDSSLAALAWRNWYRIGRIVVALMLVISIATVLLTFVASPSANILLILLVPTALLAAVGPKLARESYFKSEFELPNYLAVLPVSNRRLLVARLFNALTISVVTWSMGLVVSVIWLATADNLADFDAIVRSLEQMFPSRFGSGWPLVAGGLLFTIYTAIVAPLPGLTLGLCGRKRFEIMVTALVYLTGVIVIVTLSWYITGVLDRLTTPEARSEYMSRLTSWIPTCLAGLLIIKFLLVAFSVWAVNRRGAFDWKSVGGWLMAGAGVCLLLVVLFCVLIPNSFIGTQNTAMIVILLFPCATLVSAFAAIDWNRHR